MSWLNGLSIEDRLEMFEDANNAFSNDIISENEYRKTLAKLGYNATDIEDNVKYYRPPLQDGD